MPETNATHFPASRRGPAVLEEKDQSNIFPHLFSPSQKFDTKAFLTDSLQHCSCSLLYKVGLSQLVFSYLHIKNESVPVNNENLQRKYIQMKISNFLQTYWSYGRGNSRRVVKTGTRWCEASVLNTRRVPVLVCAWVMCSRLEWSSFTKAATWRIK